MSYLIAPVHEKMAENLPSIKKSDEGKVLVVKNGKWVAQKAQGGSAPLPELAKVATSGSYKDLKNKPDLSVYIKEADYLPATNIHLTILVDFLFMAQLLHHQL